MRYLRTGTNNVIVVGPAVIGSTDGQTVTPSTGLTNATVDEVGVYKHGATALTSTTAAAMTHRAGGMYTLTLTTGFVDTVGRLDFYLRDDSACLPVHHEFTVLPAQVYDSLVAGTDDLDVQVSGIDANAITATAIASNALTSAKIAANAIGATQIASNAITAAKIATDAITAAKIAANAIGASELAADAVTEIVAGINASTLLLAIEGQTDDIGAAGAGLTAVPWNAAWDAEVQSEVTDALVAHNLDRLALTATTTHPVIGTWLDKVMNATTGQTFSQATDSLEAIRNRGDVAWLSSTAGSVQANVTQINGSSAAAITLGAQLAAQFYAKLAAGAAGSVTLSTDGVRTADYYEGQVAHIVSGPGAGQSRYIVSGTTALVQTVSPNWVTNPTTASWVTILPAARAITASSALPNVNVTALGGSSQSLLDLKDFADAGYDPANNRLATVPTNWFAMSISTAGVVAANTTQIEGSDATNQLTAAVNASTLVQAIEGQTDDIGAAGAGLTAVPWNSAWDAEVQSEVTDALVAANLDHVALTATTTLPAVGTYLGQIMHASTDGTFSRTTDSLEAIRNRGDAAWTGGSSGANPANFDKLSISTAGVLSLINVTQIEGTDATDQLTAAVNASTAITGLNDLSSANVTTAVNASTAITGLNDLSSANVTAAVNASTAVQSKTGYSLAASGLDAVTIAEPSARPEWGTVTARTALGHMLAPIRNKVIQNSTSYRVRNDADNANIVNRPVSATTSTVTISEPTT